MQLEIYHMVVLFGFTVRSLQLHAIRNLNIFYCGVAQCYTSIILGDISIIYLYLWQRIYLSYQFPQLLEFEPNFKVRVFPPQIYMCKSTSFQNITYKNSDNFLKFEKKRKFKQLNHFLYISLLTIVDH